MRILALAGLALVSSQEAADGGLTEWLNSLEGGYFNNKQEIRLVDPNDSSTAAVFAREAIAKGEMLTQVPWSAIIAPTDEDESRCSTTRNLVEAMRSTEESQLDPYVDYLSTVPNLLPSGWTSPAKSLLVEILGVFDGQQNLPPFDPVGWLDDWYNDCNGSQDDTLSAMTYLLVTQLADDDFMVPIQNMYQHRNGDYHNIHAETNKGVNYEVSASRAIEAGEQLHNSLNLCWDCDGRKEAYGTAEILRDYGIIEPFPQRWALDGGLVEFDLKDTEGQVSLQWHPERNVQRTDPHHTVKVLRSELRRLHKVRNIHWNTNHTILGKTLTDIEWNTAWEYHAALVDALSYAINDIVENEEDKVPILSNDADQVCTAKTCGSHYDDLKAIEEHLASEESTTGESFLLKYLQEKKEESKVSFEIVTFAHHDGDSEPHRHEFSGKYAGKLFQQAQRVLFVGDGKSKMWDEIVKNDKLTKIVAFDSAGRSKPYQEFQSQPHINDDRVEWWFGGIANSLVLLPQDFWASFDLVVADIPDSELIVKVSGGTQVFDVLALLLKPEGALVKQASGILTDSSYVQGCGPMAVNGIHKIGIVDGDPKGGGKAMDLKYMHDYKKLDLGTSQDCPSDDRRTSSPSIQSASVGILSVIDTAMKAGSPDPLNSIRTTVESLGLTPVGSSKTAANTAVVVMKEGYVVARTLPDKKYFAVDINMWARFDLQEPLREALVKSPTFTHQTSVHVTVGGMMGSNSWDEDRARLESRLAPSNAAADSQGSIEESELSSEEATRAAITEVMQLLSKEKLTVGVVCGEDDEFECEALEAVSEQDNVEQMVLFRVCEGLDSDAYKVPLMYECEKSMTKRLEESLKNRKKMDMVIIDGLAPLEMGQIFDSLWSDSRVRDYWLAATSVLVAVANNPEENPWQRNFLEKFRKSMKADSVSRAEIELHVDSTVVEVGVVTKGSSVAPQELYAMESKLESELSDVQVDLRRIVGGRYGYTPYVSADQFSFPDYDEVVGSKQAAGPALWGWQNLFSLELAFVDAASSFQSLTSALNKAMAQLNTEVSTEQTFSGVGGGAVTVALFATGNAVLVWDGGVRAELNLFLTEADGGRQHSQTFFDTFLSSAGQEVTLDQHYAFQRGRSQQ